MGNKKIVHFVAGMFMLLISSASHAEDFKILFINTDKVKIGSANRKVGDVFNDGDKITWKDEKQAMKVMSLDTKKQYVFVSEDFKRRKLKSAKDYFIKSYHLSTRGLGDLSSVSYAIGDCIYLLDSTSIPIEYEPEEGEYFFLLFDDKKHVLEMANGELIFDQIIFRDLESSSLQANLMFHYNDGYNELLISGLTVTLLPQNII